jgi:hypothetical protein
MFIKKLFPLFIMLLFGLLTISEGKNDNVLLKIAKEQEDRFWKNPDNSYVAWNIAVDYYTKLYQTANFLELQENLVRLHIEGVKINAKNLNFFNLHYGYAINYPLKVSVLNLKNYPKFDYYLYDKTLPLFINIYNDGTKDLDLGKAIFVLENISRSEEKLLNNDDVFKKLLGDSLINIPINKILKSKESFSFILLFTYSNLPKSLKITIGEINVNVIFFENLPLIESPPLKA